MNNMKRRILVVDDNVDLCETVKYLLEKNGPYDVKTESDSTKTLETIYQFRPELILLDITMPNVNGYDICERVKSDKVLNFIKIIFVTGNVNKEQRLRGYEVGADDYITKPFENEELLAKVKVFLKLKYTEEMSQMKSNILDILSQEESGFFQKMFGGGGKKSDAKGDHAAVEGLSEVARGKTTQAYEYVKNAMFLSKMMEGVNLERKQIAIEKIISEALHKVKSKGVSKKVTFQIKQYGTERQGEMDYNLMVKAFTCVLSNVIEHSPKNVEYQIIINYENPEYCEICVQDSGDDFDDKNCDEVFNEFMTFAPQENKRGQDLSVVCAKKIVQLHSGDLTFQTDHEGSYYWVFQIYYTGNWSTINEMFY